MRRYFRVYRSFFVSSFARELEFRVNFFAKIGQNLMWIGFFILILLVIFSNTNSVAGWNYGEAFALGGTVFFMSACASALFFSLNEIPGQVRQGTMDFVVTKPIDSQFWVSLRRFNFDQAGPVVAGLGMLIYGVHTAKLHPTLAMWLCWALLVVCSLVIFYSVTLMLMTLSVWLIRVDNLFVLTESIINLAQKPMDIFSTGVQRVFTYAVPLSFIATIPSRMIVQGVDLPMVALGVAWAVVALVASRLFWQFALRRYTSASS